MPKMPLPFKKIISFGLICVAAISASTALNAAPLVLRAGASDPEGSTAPSMAIGKLTELITQLSKGELEAKPFYQSLGIEQQLATAVKSGSVDIGFTATSNLAPFTEAFLQFDLPFLFKNAKAAIDALETHPAGKKAIAQMEKDMGVKVLLLTSHTYDAPVSGTDIIMRSKQIKVPDDLKGLKIRTASTPVEIAIMKSYGANPTPIPYGQLYTALQQGVVDGNAATPIVPAASIKLYEVAKTYTAIGFRINILPLYMNQKKFYSLTPSQQKAILDAAEQVKPLAGQWAREKVQSALADFSKAGVQIYYPNKEEMTKWLAVREALWTQIANDFKGKIDLNIANEMYKLRPQ